MIGRLKVFLAVVTFTVSACAESDFASQGASKEDGKKKKKSVSDKGDLEIDDDDEDEGADENIGLDDGGAESNGGSDDDSGGSSDTSGATDSTIEDSDIFEDGLDYNPDLSKLEITDGILKICTKQDSINLSVINDVNLPSNAGYANVDGTGSFALPSQVIRAKGYILSLSQDDAGAWMEVNGQRILQMKNANYAAGTWFFDGLSTPQRTDSTHSATKNFLNQIGGASKAADIVVQGFSLKSGENSLKGNVRDIFGSFRTLAMTLQVRSLVRAADQCP